MCGEVVGVAVGMRPRSIRNIVRVRLSRRGERDAHSSKTKFVHAVQRSYILMARLRRLAGDICFATASGGAADAVCQALESCTPDQAHGSFDWRRSFAFSTFTGVYIGGVCSGIYSLYPRAAHGLLRRTPSAREEGLVATLLDNLVHVPALYIPSFYIGTSLLRGDSTATGLVSLQNNWRESVLACITFWLPAQFVIFSMVPVSMRVKCVAAGDCAPLPLPNDARHNPLTFGHVVWAVTWNVALSYLAHRHVPAHGHANTGPSPIRIADGVSSLAGGVSPQTEPSGQAPT